MFVLQKVKQDIYSKRYTYEENSLINSNYNSTVFDLCSSSKRFLDDLR